jgi:hypothetical protein
MNPRDLAAMQLRTDVELARSEYLRAAREFLTATKDQDSMASPDGLFLVQSSAHFRDEAFQRYRAAVKRLTEFVLR